jgi:hypothetical protein
MEMLIRTWTSGDNAFVELPEPRAAISSNEVCEATDDAVLMNVLEDPRFEIDTEVRRPTTVEVGETMVDEVNMEQSTAENIPDE